MLESAKLNEMELAQYCLRKGLYAEQIREWCEACEQAVRPMDQRHGAFSPRHCQYSA